MKKIVVFCLLLLSFSGFSQEVQISPEDEKMFKDALGSMFNSDFDFDIDTSIYTVNSGSTYFTEDERAAIVPMLVPVSFEKMKEDMNKENNVENFKTIDKGEVEMNGKQVLFIKQLVENEGEEFIMFIYCKENDKNSSLTMTALFEKEKESFYKPHVEKAIATLKIKKQ